MRSLLKNSWLRTKNEHNLRIENITDEYVIKKMLIEESTAYIYAYKYK